MTVRALDAEELAKIMADALLAHIRETLRKRIMERIEPDIQASVDAVMERFKVIVAAWGLELNETTFKVLVEDRREGKR